MKTNEWSASCPIHFTVWGKPTIFWTGIVDPGASLDRAVPLQHFHLSHCMFQILWKFRYIICRYQSFSHSAIYFIPFQGITISSKVVYEIYGRELLYFEIIYCQLIKKVSAYHGIWNSNTVLTRAHYLSSSWARWIQLTSSF